jgi:dTDP-4-dehydrorhamnose 3,5-epimerase
MIHGVIITPLKQHIDERGELMEILRCDAPHFAGFGQVYVTTAHPGIVKAWHAHRFQTDNFTCVEGAIRMGLYDSREASPTRGAVMDLSLSRTAPLLVTIPPLVYHGFECLSGTDAVVVNTVSELYNYQHPDEIRINPFTSDIPFQWRATRGW